MLAQRPREHDRVELGATGSVREVAPGRAAVAQTSAFEVLPARVGKRALSMLHAPGPENTK
jgi:hypothetical protein